MTRYEKIAVSLPLRAAESARLAVRRGHATSVSAYIAAAVEEKSQKESLAEMLAEMLAETGGPPSAKERRGARKTLGLPPLRKPRRRAAR